jgi:hypothetical protein
MLGKDASLSLEFGRQGKENETNDIDCGKLKIYTGNVAFYILSLVRLKPRI